MISTKSDINAVIFDEALPSSLNQPAHTETEEEKPYIAPRHNREDVISQDFADVDQLRRKSFVDFMDRNFYEKENWFDEMFEILFKIKKRNTTIKSEIYFGFIHFISCLYVLAVIPNQLSDAGYDKQKTTVSIAVCIGIGSILSGLFSNLPFVLAPPTVVSIFLSVYLQQYYPNNTLMVANGNVSVVISGFVLLFFGWRPLGNFAAHLIPISIQVGTAVGIGMLTALTGSVDVHIVEQGDKNILKLGQIDNEIILTFFGIIIICVATNYHIQGAFCLALIICSIIWWGISSSFPDAIVGVPHVNTISNQSLGGDTDNLAILSIDLFFLYVLYLNGIVASLGRIAALTREDETVPRGRWLFVMCGLFTIISGCMSSAPILLSPESAAAIKAGAKTGLSVIVCGCLFLLSVFFTPFFTSIPAAGSSPVLIMIGVMLFQNVGRVEWKNLNEATPAFIVLFYIPFTYSVIQGVLMGYVVYIIVNILSGDLFDYTEDLALLYIPAVKPLFDLVGEKIPFISRKHKENKKIDELKKQLINGSSEGGSMKTSLILPPNITSSRKRRETVDLFSFDNSRLDEDILMNSMSRGQSFDTNISSDNNNNRSISHQSHSKLFANFNT